jgi:hypothetical protein
MIFVLNVFVLSLKCKFPGSGLNTTPAHLRFTFHSPDNVRSQAGTFDEMKSRRDHNQSGMRSVEN